MIMYNVLAITDLLYIKYESQEPIEINVYKSNHKERAWPMPHQKNAGDEIYVVCIQYKIFSTNSNKETARKLVSQQQPDSRYQFTHVPSKNTPVTTSNHVANHKSLRKFGGTASERELEANCAFNCSQPFRVVNHLLVSRIRNSYPAARGTRLVNLQLNLIFVSDCHMKSLKSCWASYGYKT